MPLVGSLDLDVGRSFHSSTLEPWYRSERRTPGRSRTLNLHVRSVTIYPLIYGRTSSGKSSLSWFAAAQAPAVVHLATMYEMGMMKFVVKAGVAVAVGAAAVYYLDKQRGAARRHRAVDQAAAMMRHQIQHAGRLERQMRGRAEGLKHSLASHTEPVDATDEMLADRVRSEIFRQSAVPKGAINIDSSNGVVTLRGEVDDLEDISSLEMAARKVGGVRDVRNLLHLSTAART